MLAVLRNSAHKFSPRHHLLINLRRAQLAGLDFLSATPRGTGHLDRSTDAAEHCLLQRLCFSSLPITLDTHTSNLERPILSYESTHQLPGVRTMVRRHEAESLRQGSLPLAASAEPSEDGWPTEKVFKYRYASLTDIQLASLPLNWLNSRAAPIPPQIAFPGLATPQTSQNLKSGGLINHSGSDLTIACAIRPAEAMVPTASSTGEGREKRRRRRTAVAFAPDQLAKRFACSFSGCGKTLAR